MTARLFGPFLMIALGAALLVGPAQGSPVEVGTIVPCTSEGAGVVDPCTTTTTVGCDVGVIGAVAPCETTTTELTEESTEPSTVPTTAPAPTSTTEGQILGENGSTTTSAPATGGASLPRTGSDNGPLTVAAVSLILTGLGLAVAERRHRVARNRA